MEKKKNNYIDSAPEVTAQENGVTRTAHASPSSSETTTETGGVNGNNQHGGSQTTTSTRQSSHSVFGRLWKVHRFPEQRVEALYKRYFSRARRSGIQVILVLAAWLDVAALITSGLVDSPQRLVHTGVMAVWLLINLTIFCLLRSGAVPEAVHAVLPVLVWVLLNGQLYCDVVLGPAPVAPSVGVGWQATLIYSIFILLPMGLGWCLVLSVVSSALHTASVLLPPYFYSYIDVFILPNVISANLLLFLGATTLGVATFLISDREYRQAFSEIKASLVVNRQMEESSKEQERLLLSVLPRHVATAMIKDLGGQLEGQFRKVYMNRHEDVSILFADIVGFTAMSSKVTPGELVKILNDLFATFDKLAHKYHQLRIKILGDCYYCVCGCPDPRPDHAVLAIHVGLAIVDAISDVREKTQSGVMMRVGVHTGAILGGVLGQNRWQYDVVGKEVTLANQMESGGIAGRVHISSVTASFLKDEFELEPGEGELREDGIRAAGLTTYLIKSVLKPYPQGTLDEKAPITENKPKPVPKEAERKRDTVMEIESTLIEREKNTSRLGNRVNMLTQYFRDDKMERDYRATRQDYSAPASAFITIVLVVSFITQFTIMPRTTISITVFLSSACILVLFSVISISSSFPKFFPKPMTKISSWIERTNWVMCFYVSTSFIILNVQPLLSMITCEKASMVNDTKNSSTAGIDQANERLEPDSLTCDYVPYYINVAVLIQICITLQVQVSFLIHCGLVIGFAAVYTIISIFVRQDLYSRRDSILIASQLNSTSWKTPGSHVTVSVSVIAIALYLCLFTRHLERVGRRLFLNQQEMRENKEKINDMRDKNEALIYNILPAHVAKLFIGGRRNDEDLYSQQYESAGVMFASCPNFNAHYTEDAVNNNGLEWIRFLNEVLSDYDDLLNEPRFANVVKIKTVGSTYMAASGINIQSPVTKDTSLRERWQHLSDLVQFAFALRETLDRINAQSFNTFMLRIGINQGPLLAGVIGAGKPHYDIWGNTVNVASRMDSTGQLGKIQVTQDTMEILKGFGYKFEKRGIVKVKGKGELLTYFLVGKDDHEDSMLPNQVSPF